MGTDIYVHLEVNGPASWQPYVSGPPNDLRPFRLHVDRCAELFQVLAGYNYPNEFPSIATPRGLPDDVTPRIAGLLTPDFGCASWVTLGELRGHPWHTPTTFSGRVSLVGYATWIAGHRSYRLPLSDPRFTREDWQTIDQSTADALVAENGWYDESYRHVYVEAREVLTPFGFCQRFLSDAEHFCYPFEFDANNEETRIRTAEDFRFVFWFD